MKSKKEAARTAKKLFAAAMSGGTLDTDAVRTIVRRLGESRPRGYIPVANLFLRLVRLEMERNRASVASAVELDSESREGIVAGLERIYGRPIEAEWSLDPSLLGGLRIQVGSDVWDGSVKNRIDRLSEKFD